MSILQELAAIDANFTLVEGRVSPECLITLQNIVNNGGSTNLFDRILIGCLLANLRDGTLGYENQHSYFTHNTPVEISDAVKQMSEEQFVKVSKTFLDTLTTMNYADWCKPSMDIVDYIRYVDQANS